ncbi:MAG: type II toxin-antitoxin system HicB family antitoxin [Deltaproteobacteria bacterium]|nr:type II toxin-antitoxin system HicB family antitoxin [Deltaproteobacteria bacterium]
MDKDTLKYKGYLGSIEISVEDGCLHGQILFINDMITYEGDTIPAIKEEFSSAVDRYIAYCKKTGRPANKPYSGTFNIRIDKELHRKAAQEAVKCNISLNEYVEQAIKSATEQKEPMKVEHTHRHLLISENNRPGTEVITTNEIPVWRPINATMQ